MEWFVINDPCHEKSRFLHMQKQKCRSTSRYQLKSLWIMCSNRGLWLTCPSFCLYDVIPSLSMFLTFGHVLFTGGDHHTKIRPRRGYIDMQLALASSWSNQNTQSALKTKNGKSLSRLKPWSFYMQSKYSTTVL